MSENFATTTTDALHAYASGDVERALSLLDSALNIAPSVESEVSLVVQAAGWLREAGRPAEARAALMEVQDWIFDQGVFKNDMVTTCYVGMLMERGLLWQQDGDKPASLLHMQAAEVAVRQIKDEETRENLLATVLANRAGAELAAGNLAEANRAVAEALELDSRTGNYRSLAHDHNVQGLILRRKGYLEPARRHFEISAEIADRNGLRKEASDASANLSVTKELIAANAAQGRDGTRW